MQYKKCNIKNQNFILNYWEEPIKFVFLKYKLSFFKAILNSFNKICEQNFILKYE